MKSEKLLQLIGEIDDNLIHAAIQDAPPKTPAMVNRKWFFPAIAACLCAVILCVALLPQWLTPDLPSDIPIHIINSDYEIQQIKGQYYLCFQNPSVPPSSGGAQVGDLSFGSIEELIQRLKTNDFEPWEFQVIKRAFPKDENGIRILNLNRVYRPKLPKDLKATSVTWAGGDCYSYTLESKDSSIELSYYFHCYDPETFQRNFAREYKDFFDRSTITITDRYEVDDRNATVILYSTHAGDFQRVRYELNKNNRTYTIDECYCLRWNGNSPATTPASDVIPRSVDVYVRSDDKCFHVSLLHPLARPEVDWLLCFETEWIKE